MLKKLFSLAVGFIIALFAGAVHAATYIDPAVSGIFADIETDVGTLAGYGWALLGVIVGTFVAFKLVKKFLNRAS